MPDLRTAIREQDPFRFIKRLPWEKITIWAIFLLLIYLLRAFFGVLFLTFIISYITHNVVSWACEKMGIADRPTHPLRYLTTVGVFLAFIGFLTGAGLVVLPRLLEQGERLVDQARDLIPRAGKPLSPEDRAERLLKEILGEKDLAEFRESPDFYPLRAELADTLRKIPGQKTPEPATARGDFVFVPRLDRAISPEEPETGPRPLARKDIRYHMDNFLLAFMGRARFAEFQGSPAYQQTYQQLIRTMQAAATENVPAFADLLNTVFRVFTYLMHFLLSIIFSFMIVIGIPSFRKQIGSLEESRVTGFYREISPSIVSFGRSMGMAFQGQAIIALVNTALTLVGLVLLGIPNPIALGVIVFACSFIPVLGVFISSAPIVLVALQEGGGILAVEAVVLIVVIHLIEAYFLNPRILGTVMKMHPLLVLVILFVGEHFFGVWGLLIGVPLCHYLVNHVILKNPLPERRPRRTQAIPGLAENAAPAEE